MRHEILQSISFRMRVILARGSISQEELTKLDEGDILFFEEHLNSPGLIEIEEQPTFQGSPGYAKGLKRVKINGRI